MLLDQWIHDFLGRRDLSRPDGRPLFAYRCSRDEYGGLLEGLRRAKCQIGKGAPYVVAATFCIFAGEWWRKCHLGGPWKWEGILSDVGRPEMPVHYLYPMIEDGLRYWGRPLLTTSGNRAFLVTLACEGGLPHRLLQKENAKLRRFFRVLLEEAERYRDSGLDTATLAEQVGTSLPKSLRQDIVFRLAGELVDQVRGLRPLVEESRTPVRDLDSKSPNWREGLPLQLDDDTARALLNSLVEDAVDVARQRPPAFRARRKLVKLEDTWELRTHLMIPPSVTAEQVERVVGNERIRVGGRFEILQGPDLEQAELIAMATEIGRDEALRFSLETLPGAATTFVGKKAAHARQFFLAFRDRSFALESTAGSSGLSELPWMFCSCEDDEGELDLISQGSLKTRREQVFVAVPEGAKLSIGCEGEFEELGAIEGLGRQLIRASGEVEVEHSKWEGLCRISTAQEQDSAMEFFWRGERLNFLSPHGSVYRSVPQLHCRGFDAIRPVPARQIEWRPIGEEQWRSDFQSCLGEAQVRLRDGSTLILQDQLQVTPSALRFRFQAPSPSSGGTVEITGLAGGHIGYPDIRGGRINLLEESEHRAVLECQAGPSPPALVRLSLLWPGKSSLDLMMPFPIWGVHFIGPDGRRLAHETMVSLNRLSGYQAVGVAPKCNIRFFLQADLEGKGASGTHNRLTQDLPMDEPGHFQLKLRTLQREFRQLLSSTTDLDACVKLQIFAMPSLSHRPLHLHVKRFEVALEPDRETQRVRLTSVSQRKISGEELNGIELLAFRLWKPLSEPEILPSERGDEGDVTGWVFETVEREPGPWLVTAWKEDLCLSRPLLWTVGEPEDDREKGPLSEINLDLNLTSAVCIRTQEERQRAIRCLVKRLARNPMDPDWDTLRGYFNLLEYLPAASFEVVRELACHREAAAVALISAEDSIFPLLLTRMEDLPFSWHLISLRNWAVSAQRYYLGLRDAFESTSIAEAIIADQFHGFYQRMVDRRPYFSVVASWIDLSVFRKRPAGGTELALAMTPPGRSCLLELRDQAAQNLLRTHADERWPDEGILLGWLHKRENLGEVQKLILEADFREPVLNAPLAAAVIAAYDLNCPPNIKSEIRWLQSFDPPWFDEAYQFNLACLAGAGLENDSKELS